MLRGGSQGHVQHSAVQSTGFGEGFGTAQPHGQHKPGTPTATHSLLPTSSSFPSHSLFLRANHYAGGSPAPTHTCRPADPTVGNWKFLLLPSFKHTHADFITAGPPSVHVSEFPFLTISCDHENIFVRRYCSFCKQTDGFQWNSSPEDKLPSSPTHEPVRVTTAMCLLTRTHKCSFPINSNLRVLLTRVQADSEGPKVPNRQ